MREQIEQILRAFAEEHRMTYASGIVPTKLAQGIKFPCVYWVLPDGEYSIRRERRTLRNTIYIVAGKTKDDKITHSVDELEALATSLFKRLHLSDSSATADVLTTRVKYGFDNSGAHAIEMVFDIFCYDGEC